MKAKLLELKEVLTRQLESLKNSKIDDVVKFNRKSNELLSDISVLLKETNTETIVNENKELLKETRRLLYFNFTLLKSLINTSMTFQRLLLSQINTDRTTHTGVFLSELG